MHANSLFIASEVVTESHGDALDSSLIPA